MLYFLGKDAFRWIGQCMEIAERIPEMAEADMKRQCFSGLLASPPPNVRENLLRWGVNDYAAVFARAVGLNALFAEPPQFDVLAADFIRNYHRAADLLYQAFMESEPHRVAASRNFRFDFVCLGRIREDACCGVGRRAVASWVSSGEFIAGGRIITRAFKAMRQTFASRCREQYYRLETASRILMDAPARMMNSPSPRCSNLTALDGLPVVMSLRQTRAWLL
jgi:hypothetical protein